MRWRAPREPEASRRRVSDEGGLAFENSEDADHVVVKKGRENVFGGCGCRGFGAATGMEGLGVAAVANAVFFDEKLVDYMIKGNLRMSDVKKMLWIRSSR